MSNLREQAIAPDQYDNPNMDWAAEGGLDTPMRQFMLEYIEPMIAGATPARVLDVGCGVAWLSQVVKRYGTTRYLGIDPSATNVKHAQKLYPGVDVRPATTEAFVTQERFDMITCIMATEHIDNIDTAIYKWKNLLDTNGRILIVAGDKKAFEAERFDYRLHVEEVDEHESVVETIRPNDPASTTDIVRSVERFVASAALSGLNLVIPAVPMPASEKLITASPKYERFRFDPIFQLMIFGVDTHD